MRRQLLDILDLVERAHDKLGRGAWSTATAHDRADIPSRLEEALAAAQAELDVLRERFDETAALERARLRRFAFELDASALVHPEARAAAQAAYTAAVASLADADERTLGEAIDTGGPVVSAAALRVADDRGWPWLIVEHADRYPSSAVAQLLAFERELAGVTPQSFVAQLPVELRTAGA